MQSPESLQAGWRGRCHSRRSVMVGQCWLQVLDRVRHHWVSSVFRAHSEPTDFPCLEKPAETWQSGDSSASFKTSDSTSSYVLMSWYFGKQHPCQDLSRWKSTHSALPRSCSILFGCRIPVISSPEAACFNYNIAVCWLCFEKLATVMDPTHDRVEKGPFRYKTSRKSSCGAWSSLCQLFLAQAVQQGWHRLLSTEKEHFQQQHWAGQWWALCDCDQPAWAKGSLLETIPKSGAFRPHPAPGSVSKDTEGGHLLLASYLVWLWWVVSPLCHILSHKDCLQIVCNCKIS